MEVKIINGKRRLVIAQAGGSEEERIATDMITRFNKYPYLINGLVQSLKAMGTAARGGEVRHFYGEINDIYAEFKEGVYDHQPYRSFILGMLPDLVDNILRNDGADNNHLVDRYTELKYLAARPGIKSHPDLTEAINQGAARVKAALSVGDPDLASLVALKAKSILPPTMYISFGNGLDVYRALRAMIPPGTDPLHAMMYLQKKVRTIKDVYVANPEILHHPPVDGVARFVLNAGLGFLVDLWSEGESITWRSTIRLGESTLSYPGGALAIYIGTQQDRVELPEDNLAIIDALKNRTVKMHSGYWKVELDRA